MHDDIDKAGTALLIAGAFGSAIGVWLNRRTIPQWSERVGAFVGGLAFSYFTTPWIMHLIGTTQDERTYAFLIGTFGMTVTTALWRLVAQSDWFGLVRDALYAKLGIVKKTEGES